MKKFLSVLAVPALSLVMVGSASAQISNTGPGSNNSVNNSTTTNSSVVCINNTNVTNNSNQSSNSGSATSNNNTNAGGAQSGSSSNSNNTNVTANSGCAAGTTPVAPNSPEAKAAGGGVAPGVGAAAVRVDAAGRVLPATGVDDVVKFAGIGLASAAVVAGAALAGTNVYRRRATN